jgi:zinc protease
MPITWYRLRVIILTLVVAVCLSGTWLWAAEALHVPLPTDPAVHMGRLDHGVAYWVRSHATPPGKVTFWMHVHTGSVNEADGQEGIAHYLEHMAFNGTQNFPPGELIKYFESIGLRFGQHQNAFTSFDQTTYSITLPDTKVETLDKGLLFLADVAFRMLLTETEIDKERNVILEEKRARKGVGQRLTEKLLPLILPGSRVARRLPIGLEETLARLQRRDFLAYYTTWYHPAKVTLLAVGDAPVATIEAAIMKHFAAWKYDTPPPADQDPGITPYTQQRAIVVTDPELTTASVEMLGIHPRAPSQTVADFRRLLVEDLGTWMVRRRLQQLIQEGKATFQSATVRRSELFGTAEQFSAEAEAGPGRWAEALRGLLLEVQRARQHGFTGLELAEAKKATLADAEYAAQTEATQDASAFLRAMNRAVSRGEQPLSAAQHLQVLHQLLPDISREEVNEVFATHFEPTRKAYILFLPEKDGLPVPNREEVLARAQEALSTPVRPWEVAEPPTSLLDHLPSPGTIAERTRFAPLQVTHVTFANNVRLHYRFMDFKKDHVSVTITLAGGEIRERAATRGITNLALQALLRPATGKFSSTRIRDFMTGKKVSIGGRMSEDTLTLDISGTPEALEDGLQLAYLLLRDARLEPPMIALWKQRQLQDLASWRTRIDARVREAAALALSGHDPRQAILTPEQVKARVDAIPQAQAWLDAILRSAPMEVAIVGDIPEDRALHLAAMYLGSLPTRPRRDPGLTPLRQVPGFSGPLTETLEVETITPRAHLMLMWRCAGWQDVRRRRLVYLVARMLERRLREEVREKRGLTYAARVYARSSKIYPEMSALYIEFATDPDKVTEAVQAARSVVETFAAQGPSREEVETVRKQLKNSLEEMLKRPRFWVGLLADLEYHGTRLEDVHGLLDQIMAFTQADIAAEAGSVVTPAGFAMVVGRPKVPSASRKSGIQTPKLPAHASQ